MSIKCILMEQGGSAVQGSGGTYLLQELEITHAPNKLMYTPGESFDKTGMIVMGTYGIDGVPFNTVDVTSSVLIAPDPLTLGTERVKIYMIAGDGTEVSTYYPITVRPVLQSLDYSGTITMSYEYGATCPGTLESVATYSDGSTQIVTATGNFSGTFTTIGTKSVTYTYTDSYGDTASYVVDYTVSRKSVAKPSWKGSAPVYSGALIDVGSATYWSNWNTSYWSVDGTTGTSAGNYTANFTLGSNYRWNDGSTDVLSLGWSIDKASISTVPSQSGSLTYTGSFQTPTWSNYDSNKLTRSGDTGAVSAGTYTVTFTPTANYKWSDGSASKNATWTMGKADRTITLVPAVSGSNPVVLTKDNLTQTVTASTPGTGTWSITGPTQDGTVPGLTANISDNGVITFTSDGVTEKNSHTWVVIRLQDTNYKTTSASFNVKMGPFWSFGAGNGETADATWFQGLKNYLASNKASTIKTSGGASILGATKTVTLSSTVLGTTTHQIRVIGIDEDGSNTVTWQTKNCLNDYTLFSSAADNSSNTTAARWIDSQCLARQYCTAYYNAFPGKSSIKTVNKGTVSEWASSRANTPVYQNETVWLLSELEIGLDEYSPLTTIYSSNYNAEHTYGCYNPYSYYNSNSSRIKYRGDNSTNKGSGYWLRSRCYQLTQYTNRHVCVVSSNGGANVDGYASTTYSLAPAFVIG